MPVNALRDRRRLPPSVRRLSDALGPATECALRTLGLRRHYALDEHVGNASCLREGWQALPLSGQAAIVAAVLDHLIVNPGTRGLNRLDPVRLTPVWRV